MIALLCWCVSYLCLLCSSTFWTARLWSHLISFLFLLFVATLSTDTPAFLCHCVSRIRRRRRAEFASSSSHRTKPLVFSFVPRPDLHIHPILFFNYQVALYLSLSPECLSILHLWSFCLPHYGFSCVEGDHHYHSVFYHLLQINAHCSCLHCWNTSIFFTLISFTNLKITWSPQE